MRTRVLLFIITCLTVWGMTACSDENSEDIHNKEMVITVASEKAIHDGTEWVAPYFIKENGKGEWRRLEGIQEFTHEDGYEYVLRIWREKWHDGEIQDVSIYRYKLLEVLSKVKKDSEDMPLQGMFLLIAPYKSTDPAFPYYARVTGNPEWTPFPEIEGFDYEEGQKYAIYVGRKFNGSNADPKYTYIWIDNYIYPEWAE